MRYERVFKRVQLSRPSKTECCITDGGTTQAHTRRFLVAEILDAQAHAGRGPQRGRFVKNRPKNEGCRAPQTSPRRRLLEAYDQTSHVRWKFGGNQYRGAPRICKAQWRPLRYRLQFGMNETSSNVTVPPMRQGLCSDSVRPRPTPEAISKPSWHWSAGASEK